MTMKRIDQIFGCIFFIFFLFLAYKARTTLTYWGEGAVVAPGPGYLPFWISVILAGLSLYWLIQITVRKGEAIPKGFFPDRKEGIRILLVFLDTIAFTAIVNYVGFPLAMFLFVMAMVVVLGKHDLLSLIYYAIFALGVAAFFTILFGQYLEVSFPQSEIEIFKRISSWTIGFN
jgi:putative tricarboxylic transport membrane protein